MKKSAWACINFIRKIIFNNRDKDLFLLAPTVTNLHIKNKHEEIFRRLKYFDENIKFSLIKKLTLNKCLNFSSIIFLDANSIPKITKIKKEEIFNLDYSLFYLDGWEYHRLLSKLYPSIYNEGIKDGKHKLSRLKAVLSKQFSRSYIYGTGPSLENAQNRDWNDGLRIVSNTIVKDSKLWAYINPHFIVASDAIYHFGTSKFAESFRYDLKNRLTSSEDTYFVYPAIFHVFCLKEFNEFKDRLIPVPQKLIKTIHHDLTSQYALPGVGNVLPQVLLPLACTFTKNIALWGFDGRAPGDEMFWKNSSKHFYANHVEELTNLHPAFFNTLLPKGSPESYVKNVHGDALEHFLSKAEKQGFSFEMLHHSHTKTLQKRFINIFT